MDADWCRKSEAQAALRMAGLEAIRSTSLKRQTIQLSKHSEQAFAFKRVVAHVNECWLWKCLAINQEAQRQDLRRHQALNCTNQAPYERLKVAHGKNSARKSNKNLLTRQNVP